MYSNSVMNSTCGHLTARIIGCDQKRFISSSSKMLQYPQYRIRNSIYVRQE